MRQGVREGQSLLWKTAPWFGGHRSVRFQRLAARDLRVADLAARGCRHCSRHRQKSWQDLAQTMVIATTQVWKPPRLS
jgi:hypothetical protein